MKKTMRNSLKRILALAMALFVVFGSIPMPMEVYATENVGEGAQTGNNVEVSVTVTNEADPQTLIAGAAVSYVLTTAEVVDETELESVQWTDVTGVTNENGTLVVLAANAVTVDESNAKLWVKVSYTGYEEKIQSFDLTGEYTEAQTMSVALEEIVQQKPTVTVNLVGGNATISVAGKDVTLDESGVGIVDVEASDSTAYTITPNSGYYIKSIKIGENAISDTLPDKGEAFNGTLDTSLSDVVLNVEVVRDCKISLEVKYGNVDCNATVVVGESTLTLTDGKYATEVAGNSTVSYTITPDANYYIKSVKVGDVAIEAEKLPVLGESFEGTLNLTNQDVAIVVELGMYYTVEVTVDGDATIVVNNTDVEITDGKGSINVAENASVKYSVTPGNNSYIKDIKVNDATIGESSIPEMGIAYTEGVLDLSSANAKLDVELGKYYTASIEITGGNAEVIVGEEEVVFSEGEASINFLPSADVAYTITPLENYYIKNILIDGTSIGEENLPKMGEAFNTGKLDLSSANVKLTIELEKYYSVTLIYDADGNGTVVTEPSGVGKITTVAIGQTIKVIATPEKTYRVAEVIINDGEPTKFDENDFIYTYDITDIKQNYTIEIKFLLNEYSVVVKEQTNGDVTISGNNGVSDSNKIQHGGTATVTVAPENGYTLTADGVEVNNIKYSGSIKAEEDGTFTFEITGIEENTTVSVECTLKEYTVTTQEVKNGTVEISGSNGEQDKSCFKHGSKATVKITPVEGYTIRADEISINNETFNGALTEENGSYIFTIDVLENTKISVECILKEYAVTAPEKENGTVDISGNNGYVNENNFKHGSSATVTITPSEGYTIDVININNVEVKPENMVVGTDENGIANGQYSFDINITEETEIMVTFKVAEIDGGVYEIGTNSSDYLRKVTDSLYVIKPHAEDERVVVGALDFNVVNQEKFNVDGIRVYIKDTDTVKLVGGDSKTASVRVEAMTSTDIVKVQVYCQPNGEICPAWYDVITITEELPIRMVEDTGEPNVTYEIDAEGVNKYENMSYYSSDVSINVTASEREDNYSGIKTIEYFITSSEANYSKEYTDYDDIKKDDGKDVVKNTIYEYDAAKGIEQSVSLVDKIVVKAEDYNSQYTRVWIKVTDRAGNPIYEVVDLNINITAPTVTLSIDGEKNDGITDAYYKSNRVLTFKIVDRADTFIVKGDTEETEPFEFVIKKDGNDIVINGDNITWKVESEDAQNAQTVYVGTYTLSEEGNYQINEDSLKYTNKAGLSNSGVTIIDEEKAELDSFVIDKLRPSVTGVEFLENITLEENGIKYYHTNSMVTAIIKASDAVSGIDKVTWRYEKTDQASEVNKGSEEEFKTAVFNEEKDGYEVQIPLTYNQETGECEQLHGHLVIQVVDKAGHTLEAYYDDSKQIFVIDTKNPIMTVAHTASDDEQNPNIYDKDITFTFTFNEANFYAEDVKVNISKDGAESIEASLTWNDNVVPSDEHVGTYVISEDGEYALTIEYTDKSGNVMKYVDEEGNEISTTYTIENLIIDTTPPEIEFSATNEQMIITVTERNFDSKSIVVDKDSKIKDIVGKDTSLSVATLQSILQNSQNWVQDKDNTDVYTCTLLMDASYDGIYNLKINYKDIVGKEAVISPEEFIIDHTDPSNVTFDYYENDTLGRLLEKLTFGYYKEKVTVVLTAYDATSGVKKFDWTYTREENVSNNILESASGSITEEIEQDEKNPGKFTVRFTMSQDDAVQLRGCFAARAGDAYGNESQQMITDDGNIIVVDSIAPTMDVIYSAANRVDGATSYYKSNTVDVTFKVTEANFYAEDVIVEVSKDNGARYVVKPQWTDTDINADEHIGTFQLSGDGDYKVYVNYEDRSKNKLEANATADSESEDEYVSNTITIDTVAPIINVEYENTNAINTLSDRNGNQREYFTGTQKATITIKEHNFNPASTKVVIGATDVAGNVLDETQLCTVSKEWTAGTEVDTHVLTITYTGDANYTFDIECVDFATNSATDYAPDYFTVDNTVPVELNASYSTSIFETVLEFITFGFYNAKVDVTIEAQDAISGINEFVYNYTNEPGVSDINEELINQAISAAEISYSNEGKTATAKFQIPKDVLTNENQFNGVISFDVIDRAGLKETYTGEKRIVVDNIAPTAQVTYNEPVNTEGTISYYNGNVNATVVITEANFYAEDVSVTVSRDGGASYAVTPSWTNNSVDIHTGTFTLTEDGDYFITINYRDKSTNQMVEYRSEQLTIDTDIEAPVITFNGNAENGQAYKEDVIPEISFTDKNYDSFEVFLYRTNMDQIEVDITEEKGINNLFSVSDQDGSASLDVFAKDENGNYNQNDDGIYHLVVTLNDKAGHTEEAEAYFTINRYGSVYKYSDYLVGLISEGGSYVTAVTEDLVITEYNADQLVTDSLDIEITRDGKPLENVDYTVSPTINETVGVGESGWYQYEYIISKENFAIDGTYKISISSKDATGNNPENSNYEDKNILFYVDSTVPEITSITGLDKSVVDDTELTVTYTVFDAIGLKSIKVYVDDEILNEVTDFSADFNNYEGSFTLEESEKQRTIRIIVEDMAGNITDTSSEEFTSAYVFNSAVTVTTNAWVRFMANKPLFYGTIGGVVGLAGVTGVVINARLKKKAK